MDGLLQITVEVFSFTDRVTPKLDGNTSQPLLMAICFQLIIHLYQHESTRCKAFFSVLSFLTSLQCWQVFVYPSFPKLLVVSIAFQCLNRPLQFLKMTHCHCYIFRSKIDQVSALLCLRNYCCHVLMTGCWQWFQFLRNLFEVGENYIPNYSVQYFLDSSCGSLPYRA